MIYDVFYRSAKGLEREGTTEDPDKRWEIGE
jgi:hypothetical protein